MDTARPLQPPLAGRRVESVEPAPAVAPGLPAVFARLEAERFLEPLPARLRIARIGAGAVEALQCDLGGDVRLLGDQRLVVNVTHPQLVPETLGIRESQHLALAADLDTLGLVALGPEVDRLG